MSKGENELDQVAAVASIVATAIRGGLAVVPALELATKRAKGAIAEDLRTVLARVSMGEATHKALRIKGSTHLQEFLAKLQTSTQLGSPLADQLDDFVETINEKRKLEFFAKANKSETRMLLPLVFMILPVSVLFALYPSLQVLNLQMEGI